MDKNTKMIAAIVLSVLAAGLIVWQFVLKPSPNAVGVEDMPKETRSDGTPRDPSAGPMPVDVSRGRGAK